MKGKERKGKKGEKEFKRTPILRIFLENDQNDKIRSRISENSCRREQRQP